MKEDALYMRSYIESLDHPHDRYGMPPHHDNRAAISINIQHGAESDSLFLTRQAGNGGRY